MDEENKKVNPTQRHFAVMGQNMFLIANKISQNQKLCRLLKYQSRDPFEDEDPITGKAQPDVDGIELLNKQILIVPKIYDDSNEKMSYVIVVFDNFVVNFNEEFKTDFVRFDIACPYDEWLLNDKSLRPYLMMQYIDEMFNKKKIAGIGNLQFYKASPLTLSSWVGGYSMRYRVSEFN